LIVYQLIKCGDRDMILRRVSVIDDREGPGSGGTYVGSRPVPAIQFARYLPLAVCWPQRL